MTDEVDSLLAAWPSFLDQWQWDWFTTHTFRHEIHPEAAHKVWNRWTHQLNREVFGVRYWRRAQDGVIWVRGLEYQRRGVIHFHALLGRIPEIVRRLDWMDKWNELAGYARIEAYDPTKGARYYLSKYVLKGGEIDLGGPLDTLPLYSFGQVVATPEPKGRAGLEVREGLSGLEPSNPDARIKVAPRRCPATPRSPPVA